MSVGIRDATAVCSVRFRVTVVPEIAVTVLPVTMMSEGANVSSLSVSIRFSVIVQFRVGKLDRIAIRFTYSAAGFGAAAFLRVCVVFAFRQYPMGCRTS